jgi:hypothetical protein
MNSETNNDYLLLPPPRFIQVVSSGDVDLMKGRSSKQELIDEMALKSFATMKELNEVRNNNALGKRKIKINPLGQEEKDSESEDESPYDYLLNMPLNCLTVEKINDLNKEAEKREIEMKIAKDTSSSDLWRADLDALEGQL